MHQYAVTCFWADYHMARYFWVDYFIADYVMASCF